MDPDERTAWISEERFAPFLERAGGEEALASELYLWHAEVAGASLTTLRHFEVTLRNAIDRQLGSDDPQEPVEATWLLDPETLSAQGIAKVGGALARLEREGHLPASASASSRDCRSPAPQLTSHSHTNFTYMYDRRATNIRVTSPTITLGEPVLTMAPRASAS